MATVIATTTLSSDSDGFQPAAGAVAHYQVFGRDSCTGRSVAP